jgi:hypothetical protein
MQNWMWFAFGGVVAWLIARDGFTVSIAATGANGDSAIARTMPSNDTAARSITDWDVKFQSPGTDTLANPAVQYGQQMGNNIGSDAYTPSSGAAATSDLASGGTAAGSLQGGMLGNGWQK